jgi:putative ABC transport system substrate-binding protein
MVGAQRQAVPVVGFLNTGAQSDVGAFLPAFHQGLHETGFTEGQNVAIEYYWAENQLDQLPAFAAELVEHRVAVIVAAPGPSSIGPAKAATTTIPIVFMCAPDPVRNGLVASLNQPGGNLTGVTLLTSDLTAKRLDLLHQLAPQMAAVAVLLDRGRGLPLPDQDFVLTESEAAARTVGVRMIAVWAGNESEFDAAFDAAVRKRVDALLVSPSGFFRDHRQRLVTLAAKYRLPASYQQRQYADIGGLMAYGPSLSDAYREVGHYAGRILRGQKPADLPVMLPTKFEFVLNLRTAKALGLTIPETLLATADEVIQ